MEMDDFFPWWFKNAWELVEYKRNYYVKYLNFAFSTNVKENKVSRLDIKPFIYKSDSWELFYLVQNNLMRNFIYNHFN